MLSFGISIDLIAERPAALAELALALKDAGHRVIVLAGHAGLDTAERRRGYAVELMDSGLAQYVHYDELAVCAGETVSEVEARKAELCRHRKIAIYLDRSLHVAEAVRGLSPSTLVLGAAARPSGGPRRVLEDGAPPHQGGRMRTRKLGTKLAAALVLASVLAAVPGCNRGKVSTDPTDRDALVVQLQRDADRFGFYLGVGVTALDEIGRLGVLDQFPELERIRSTAHTALSELKQTSQPFLDLVKTIIKLDVKTRQDALAAFAAVNDGVQKLRPKLEEAVQMLFAYLNEKKITSVDLDQLARRVKQALDFIDGAAKLIRGGLSLDAGFRSVETRAVLIS